MICSNCGAENRDNSKFCFSCGYEISVKAEDSEEIVDVTPITPVEDSKKRKKFKKVLLCVVAVLACILVLAFSGYLVIKDFIETRNEIERTTIKPKENLELEYNGYSLNTIRTYERRRFYSLMRENNLTDYSMNGNKRDYNYTVEDYKKMNGLDETYLYAIYTNTNDIYDFLEALGYKDIPDFLTKNNYVNEYGKPSVLQWRIETAKDTSQQMLEILEGEE